MKRALVAMWITFGATAQQGSLPANYKTTFENADLLVMRVHYGPHEFVPMHDHTAYPTLYVYLSDSGPVTITHEKPDNLVLTRPPTHTGAFRLAPGAIERHSVQSQSDTPSDFLRVELKRIPPHDLKASQHFAVPNPLPNGFHAEFRDRAIEVDRLTCPAQGDCQWPALKDRALLIAIHPATIATRAGTIRFDAGDTRWLNPGEGAGLYQPSAEAQFLILQLHYRG